MNEFSLWLLKPRDDIEGKDPWNPWYDKAFGFVVSARDEAEARQIANAHGGDEVGPVRNNVYRTGGNPWLDERFSTCERLVAPNEATVIMRDYARA